MSSAFLDAFARLLPFEGGFSDDPADPGNWTGGAVGVGVLRGTKYGISAASYPTLDIAGLTPGAATALYRAGYWDKIAGDALPGPIAAELFDCAVNQGVGFAARTLQAALHVAVDGVIGPQTVAAAARAGNDPLPVVVEIAARRAVRYAGSGGFSRFGYGWMRRLMDVTVRAIAPA